MLPDRPGTYVFVARLPRSEPICVGRLGQFEFPSGWYAYVGSARGPGGLAARAGRHMRRPKPLRWHIDYLRARCLPEEVWYTTDARRLECTWAAALSRFPGASTPVNRFGASDCSCVAHLIHFPTRPSLNAFSGAVDEPIRLHRVER